MQATSLDMAQRWSTEPVHSWQFETLGFWHIPTTYYWIAGLAAGLGLLTIIHAYILRAYGRAKFVLISIIIMWLMFVNIRLILIAGDIYALADWLGVSLPEY